MRTVLSISLPQGVARYIERQTKTRGFQSKSAYFQHLIRQEQTMITEDDVVKFDHEALREHKAGKTRKLRSLADLMS